MLTTMDIFKMCVSVNEYDGICSYECKMAKLYNSVNAMNMIYNLMY